MAEHIKQMGEIINAIVPIETIQPHPRNYNVHPQFQIDGLKKSLDRFKQYRSVVLWQQSDGTYIQVAGHGVLEAMQQRGDTKVRADILPEDTDPLDIEGILAADNQFPLLSTTNEELLAMLLQEQLDAGFDLRSLGTDDETLRQMLEGLGDEHIGRTTELNEPAGGEVESAYNVLIECENELEQQRAYELVDREGFKCRVLTL